MSQRSARLAFPVWRDHWMSLEGVPTLLAKADALLQRRATGNQRMPRWIPSEDRGMLALGIRALQDWANGEPPTDTATRPHIIRHIHIIVQPLLHATAWPRWLLLERAFFDGSETGDLLFAALMLRTMCEELQRLSALDLDADQLACLAESNDSVDQEQLKQFLSAAWISLGTLPQEMVLDGKSWPRLDPMPELDKARQALNSYVHPNYGSHIAALFPERSGAARLLLQTMVAVYEAFFALSWAERSVADPSAVVGIGALESWPRTVERFQSDVLPEIQQLAESPVVAGVMKLPAAIEWLAIERVNLEDMLGGSANSPFLKDLPRRPMGASADSAASRSFEMWDGARAIDVINLASARRAEQYLVEEFPSGAPKSTDQTRWLRFNAQSIGLAMLLDQVKAAAFKTQLIRQITEGNGLGILLCVRSLIEHRALASWLPAEVSDSLNVLAGQIQAASPLPHNAADVEQPIANFLSVQAKRSKEDRRSWVMRESGGIRTARLNLRNIVDAAFPHDDRFRRLYALASATMHGRMMRGCDLSLDFESSTRWARFVGLLVLERLCSRDEEMDHLAGALRVSVQLDHAAGFGGTLAAATDRTAQQVFGRIEDALVPGVDYTGEGTAANPFLFGSHLQFHQASYALLKQLGVDVTSCPCLVDHSAAGCLCDRWRARDRDYWFQLLLPKTI